MAPADRDQDGDDPHEPLVLDGFDPFFRAYFTRLTASIRLKGWPTMSVEDAKDIAMDVMVALHQRLKNGGGPIEKPLPYIFKSARNAIFAHRRRKEHRGLSDTFWALDRSRTCCDGDPETYLAEKGLHSMLGQLPRNQQEVMVLWALGYEPRDIAQILDRTPDSVRQAKTKALKRLRETSAAWGDRPGPSETGKEDDR